MWFNANNLSIDLLLMTCGLMQTFLFRFIALDMCFNANHSIDLLLMTCDLMQTFLLICCS